MQIILYGARMAPKLLRVVNSSVKVAGKVTLNQVLPASAQYARGVLTGKAKYELIGGAAKARIADVTPALTSGIQTRQLVTGAIRYTLGTGPAAAGRLAKVAIRTSVRDTLALPYAATHLYQLYRLERTAAGLTSKLERGADATLMAVTPVLRYLGIAPTISGTLKSLGRITAVGGIYVGARVTGGRLDALWDATEPLRESLTPAIQHTRLTQATPMNFALPTPPPTPAVPVQIAPPTKPTPAMMSPLRPARLTEGPR